MAKKPHTPPKTFEEAIAELEKILAEIEQGQSGLEDTLVRYERGTFLIQHCRQVLSLAEKQIELISRAADGSLQTKPLESASSDSTEDSPS